MSNDDFLAIDLSDESEGFDEIREYRDLLAEYEWTPATNGECPKCGMHANKHWDKHGDFIDC